MKIVETCPVCDHELFEELIYTYPMARYKYCENCGWHAEEEPEYKDDEYEQRN